MTTTTTDRRWHIIGKGLAGWHASGINVSSSGGDIEPRTWWADGQLLPTYQSQAVEGAPVYDARDADGEAFRAFIFNGPMCSPKLEPNGWTKYGHDEAAPRSLDFVGVERYIDLLRAIPGMKFGRVRDGVIEWEGI